jgi:hypothetical protein
MLDPNRRSRLMVMLIRLRLKTVHRSVSTVVKPKADTLQIWDTLAETSRIVSVDKETNRRCDTIRCRTKSRISCNSVFISSDTPCCIILSSFGSIPYCCPKSFEGISECQKVDSRIFFFSISLIYHGFPRVKQEVLETQLSDHVRKEDDACGCARQTSRVFQTVEESPQT